MKPQPPPPQQPHAWLVDGRAAWLAHDPPASQDEPEDAPDVEDADVVESASAPAAVRGEHGNPPEPGPHQVPLLAVRNTVVFPNTVVPLTIGRPKSLAAVAEAMKGGRALGILTERPEHTAATDEVTGEGLHDIGTWAVIHKMIRVPTGDAKVLVQGLARIRLDALEQTDPFLLGNVTVLEDERPERSPELDALMRNCVEQAEKVVSLSPYLPEELSQAITALDDPLHLAYLVGSVLKMDLADKQAVLEADTVEEKLEKVTAAVVRELQVLQIGGKIQSQVATELEKKQKEYFLREQLRAIKEELGEGDDEASEIADLRDQIEAADLPEHVLKEARREVGRLEKMHSSSPEYHVIRTYLDWLIAVPWSVTSEDNLDLKNARQVLDEDHHDLESVKDRLIEYLAVRKLKPDHKGPILCLVGPPGVGKTSLGKSVARALGRKFQRMSLGGIHDEAEIRGHRRTYVGALPGRIVQAIKRAGTSNPVIMLDEIDKVGHDFRGDPSSALLEVLDPEQNSAFRDHYLDVDLDLSRVLFIATANVLDTIQPALRDRMEVIQLAGYATEDKLHIAREFLLPKQKVEHGIADVELEVSDEALRAIASSWTSEAGVRGLERQVATLCRKLATRKAEGEALPTAIGAEELSDYLGPQRHFPEAARRTKVPGVATGLAWTQAGGEILFIEAIRMPGKGQVVLTGQLGDVMQESAKTALSYVRSVHGELGLPEGIFAETDVHVHVPAGAIPKDGPSAGVAMATAVASAFTGRCVRNCVAMTGELTLTGLVLPVGGIREKVLAAKRAGMKEVVLPKRNEADVADIPARYREGLEILLVGSVGEVWAAALCQEGAEEASAPADRQGAPRVKKARRAGASTSRPS